MLGPRMLGRATAGAEAAIGWANTTGAATTGGTAAAIDSRSRLTMRPPGPVPVSCARLIPFSCAMRFARGDAFTRPLPAAAGAAVVGAAAEVIGCAGAALFDTA